MLEKLLIPVSDEVDGVDELFIERHCAEKGWIVTNVTLAPQNSYFMAGDERFWQGDKGIHFWIADVVASEGKSA